MSTRRVRMGAAVVAVVVVVLAGVLGAPPAAGAADLPVSGTFTATGNFESLPECPSFHTWHAGGGEWTGLGTVTFDVDYCVDLQFLPIEASPLVGTFTIATEAGTLTGDVAGEVSNISGPGGGFPATYELTITGGTGSYQLATGTLVLDAVWNDPVIPVFAMAGTVSGTVVLPPPTPTSKDDCRHGGWRHLADEHGRPFRNQGHCITWVHHHL